ncbi:MAG TPA: AAA family ATPase [Candidatus Paceibacterota bacterium]|nr:AAA family ATPase [Candidatus Paceibacterota bacterium]
MGKEIERRWLVFSVDEEKMPKADKLIVISQGYMERSSPLQSLRVRILNGSSAVITGKTGSGMVRQEDEHSISLKTAEMLMGFCDHRIEKSRSVFGKWTLDAFFGELHNVVILEYESDSEEEVAGASLPAWVTSAVEVTDSLTNLHLARLATDLKGTGADPVTALERRLTGRIRRVVIAGGPGSGKSTLLEEIRAGFPNAHIVPEVATIIIGQVGIKPFGDEMALRRFQRAVWRTQLIFEMTSMEQALAEGKNAVVVDRGTVDCAAYLPGGIAEMEELFRTSLEAEYRRYDAVLWLPVPPQHIYDRIRKNNPARSEDYRTAVDVGNRIFNAWMRHPQFRRLDSLDTRTGAWDEHVVNAFRLLRPFLDRP